MAEEEDLSLNEFEGDTEQAAAPPEGAADAPPPETVGQAMVDNSLTHGQFAGDHAAEVGLWG